MDIDKPTSPFLQRVQSAIRIRHYSIRTERSYLDWTRRFILFNKKRHPDDMGDAEVTALLSHLAMDRNVATATQNQALNALVFLYKNVLNRPLGEIQAARARRRQKLPVALTQAEVGAVLKQLEGHYWLAACLMYGSGLRLMECMRLRVMRYCYRR